MIKLNLILAIILGGGWLFSRLFAHIKLPPVLGMLVFGILCSTLIKDHTHPILWELDPYMKSFALIVILLRGGLGVQKKTLQKVGKTAILMSFIPCLIEGLALTLIIHYVFNFHWFVAGLSAFMLSAVSPAVIVPSMLDLKQKGHNKIPTIIMAGASVDDVFAITLFSVFLSLTQSNDLNIIRTVLSIPLSIVIGVLSGLLLGFSLLAFFKKRYRSIRATEKTLIVLVFGTLLVQVGDILHFAALLGLMTLGFVLLEKNEKIAHEISSKLSKLWIPAEIILFVLIGFSLNISVAFTVGIKGVLIISGGLVFRSLGVLIATIRSGLKFKERFFCMIAYLPKATVQAALGGVALSYAIPEGEIILAFAVIAILITAPIGLAGIRFFSPRFLELTIPD